MARPIFCGNFEYDARQSDLERLFRRYGRVERVDMKSGFAFIYMEDERDADDAIRALDRIEFGRKGRKLRVEWTKDREVRKPVASRRSSGNTKPSKTLFVINFDPYQTRKRDLERHFESYGKIVSVRIRRNFAFVQYDSQEDASRALDATNMSKLMGRVLSVEYAVRDDDDDGRRNGYSPDRSRDRSPGRRGHDRRRSPSPYRRERDSPDYGRGPSPGPYRRERGSPDYGRRGSPSPYRRERPSPEYARGTSRSRSRSHSPSRRDRAGSDHGLASRRSPYEKERRSPYEKERRSYEKERRTPHEKERRSYEKERGKPENDRTPSPAPYRRERASPDNGRSSSLSPRKREGASPENGLGRSQSPYELEKVSPENGGGNSSRSMPEAHNSHDYAEEDSPMQQRYDSRSPPAE